MICASWPITLNFNNGTMLPNLSNYLDTIISVSSNSLNCENQTRVTINQNKPLIQKTNVGIFQTLSDKPATPLLLDFHAQ